MKKLNYLITLFLTICITGPAVGLCACDTSSQECTHDVLAKVNANDPTCTEDGNVEYWHCSTCLKNFADANGNTELKSVTVPATGHSAAKVDAVNRTCTEDGNVEYWHCSTCLKDFADANGNTELKDVTLPATGHSTVKVDANGQTCTEDGNVEYWHCNTCLKNFADANGNAELKDVTLPAGHDLNVEYKYEEKIYHIDCNRCDYSEDVNAGSAQYPYLARNEEELHKIVDAAAENSVFQLANDIEVTSVWYEGVYTLPEGSTLDLGGYTVNVKDAPGCFVIQGTNVTIQNGTLDLTHGGDYSLYVGDEGENNIVTVKNITTNAGINVYNCVATIIDCNVDASQRDYYALWGDEHSTINVESGTYIGGRTACVHSCANAEDEEGNGNVIINGGAYIGDIFATNRTEIHGGVIDGTVKLTVYNNCPAYLLVDKDYNESLNIVCGKPEYTLVQTTDENGNKIYQQN